ncbi:uncharacterized protein BO96DRAFT_265431 [Aspergillus niger CBS 101883]|uniref:uncharacterized protein n=1 Tax=Aspergillus lacticoffeatus (strain CBS 101883) TaxID=1450533 RepID=UPI000D7FF419|nr:uncharacterized protein BO96DRAFT_265431 [Aspergillus niger CBS 101883]PYH57772.1 hypothetical protein BO96DRAFT_265431 [Aspergillus niger CBS 101883]
MGLFHLGWAQALPPSCLINGTTADLSIIPSSTPIPRHQLNSASLSEGKPDPSASAGRASPRCGGGEPVLGMEPRTIRHNTYPLVHPPPIGPLFTLQPI